MLDESEACVIPPLRGYGMERVESREGEQPELQAIYKVGHKCEPYDDHDCMYFRFTALFRVQFTDLLELHHFSPSLHDFRNTKMNKSSYRCQWQTSMHETLQASKVRHVTKGVLLPLSPSKSESHSYRVRKGVNPTPTECVGQLVL
jgi:hypothetical protein